MMTMIHFSLVSSQKYFCCMRKNLCLRRHHFFISILRCCRFIFGGWFWIFKQHMIILSCYYITFLSIAKNLTNTKFSF